VRKTLSGLRFIARIAAWCSAVAIVALSVVPPQLRPVTGAPQNIEHFTIYFVCGLAFSLGYGHRGARSEIVLGATLVLFAGLVEIAQLFVPGRHARLSDFIVDALAMISGVVAIAVIRRVGAGTKIA
jgi:VanZ family protein